MAEIEAWIAIIVGTATAAGVIFSIIQGNRTAQREQKKTDF